MSKTLAVSKEMKPSYTMDVKFEVRRNRITSKFMGPVPSKKSLRGEGRNINKKIEYNKNYKKYVDIIKDNSLGKYYPENNLISFSDVNHGFYRKGLHLLDKNVWKAYSAYGEFKNCFNSNIISMSKIEKKIENRAHYYAGNLSEISKNKQIYKRLDDINHEIESLTDDFENKIYLKTENNIATIDCLKKDDAFPALESIFGSDFILYKNFIKKYEAFLHVLAEGDNYKCRKKIKNIEEMLDGLLKYSGHVAVDGINRFDIDISDFIEGKNKPESEKMHSMIKGGNKIIFEKCDTIEQDNNEKSKEKYDINDKRSIAYMFHHVFHSEFSKMKMDLHKIQSSLKESNKITIDIYNLSKKSLDKFEKLFSVIGIDNREMSKKDSIHAFSERYDKGKTYEDENFSAWIYDEGKNHLVNRIMANNPDDYENLI